MENVEVKKILWDTYKGKNVFVTGHTGFKGSWFSLWLSTLNARIKGYSLAPQKGSLYESFQKKIEIESIIADLREKAKLEKSILNFQPDFIFHFAAQPLVRYSYENPLETFEINSMGTTNLLNAVIKLKKKCSVIIVTTDKVYENKEQNHAYNENDRLGGHDPYSASKTCAEIITQSYRLSFFNPTGFTKHKKSIATVRAGNVIGGGDYAKDRIIPDIVRALQKNVPIKIRNPKSIRPWQHVLDPLSGYLLLGAKMKTDPVKYSTAYNFGPNSNDIMTVEELVQNAISLFGSGNYITESLNDNRHEAGLLTLDNSKAKGDLGWQPVYNSRKAIEHTIEWYKKSFEKGVDTLELCLKDIKYFTT